MRVLREEVAKSSQRQILLRTAKLIVYELHRLGFGMDSVTAEAFDESAGSEAVCPFVVLLDPLMPQRQLVRPDGPYPGAGAKMVLDPYTPRLGADPGAEAALPQTHLQIHGVRLQRFEVRFDLGGCGVKDIVHG